MSKGYLVNDHLTCIPGTSTLWNDLLRWIPGLEDKTGIDYSQLAEETEKLPVPDYIIRNATYFRRMQINCPQISLLQDIADNPMQRDVLENSQVVVNSEYTLSHYPYLTNARVIPLGVDFDHFHILSNKQELRKKWNIHGNTICFIGAQTEIKGWDSLVSLIEQTPEYNFVLVLKDNINVRINAGNYRVFCRVNHQDLVEIINCCDAGICTSVTETQHLSGIEMGACGLPLVTTNVGIYYNREPGEWGCRYKDPKAALELVLSQDINPREYWLRQGVDLVSCKKSWINLVEEVTLFASSSNNMSE